MRDSVSVMSDQALDPLAHLEQEAPDLSLRVKIAEHLHVEWVDGKRRLLIDGVPLGYATVDGYHVHVTKNEMPAVTLTIAAKKVTVDHDPFTKEATKDA